MTMQLDINPFQRLRHLIRKKNKGNSTFWLTGLVAISMTMFICYFVLMFQKLNFIRNSLEDEITSAALSGLIINLDSYAITANLDLIREEDSLKNFEDIFAYSEGLEAFDSSGQTYGSPDHVYFDFEDPDNRVSLIEYTMYEINKEPDASGRYMGEIHTFKNGTWTHQTDCNFGTGLGTADKNLLITTSAGEKVERTGIYINIKVPIKTGYFGIRNYVDKKQFVAVEYILNQ